MNKTLAEDIKGFDTVFGPFNDHPGYKSFREEFIKNRTEHPEVQKPSDIPFAKTFHYIDWDNPNHMSVFIKAALDIKLRLYDEYSKSLRNGTVDEFVNSLIDDVARFKCVAFDLHAQIDLIRNPIPRSRAMIHVVK